MDVYHKHDYWPTDGWQTASLQDMHIDPIMLSHMQKYIEQELPGLHSLLIVRHGYLAFEAYYQGFHQNSYNNVASVTKSLISLLIGIALGEGKLTSVDQPMLEFFPEWADQETDQRKQAVALHHLLSLTGGFSPEFPHEYWLHPVQLAVARPMVHQPGEEFFYDSQGVDILSGILTRITGMSAAAYADATLFAELGIWRQENSRFTWKNDPQGAHTWHQDADWDEHHGYLWKSDPQGYSTGGFGAHLTAREMAKIGYLCLNQGIWNGKRLLPEAYFTESTQRQSAGGPPIDTAAYGYLWWITEHQGHATFFASGYGGRMIYVIPSLDLVVVTTASSNAMRSRPQQTEQIRDLVPRFILPALRFSQNAESGQW